MANSNKVLESKYIFQFKAEVTPAKPLILEVSGLCGHSSYTVDKIVEVAKEDEINLQIFIVPAVKGKSGSFKHVLEIPATIKRVTIGNDHHVIWSR